MKKEYDFSKAKKRSERITTDPSVAKIPTSIRLDGAVLAWFKSEATRLGIPYQTLVSSILHRYANSEFFDKSEIQKLQKLKQA